MQLKYSVIVPVYNAEKTIRRCVDSLLSEQFENAEVILVNDGSKDASGKICREYAQRLPNVRFIYKENGGVSTARNAGLDAATGEYVLFVDSDDYVSSDFFSILEESAPCDWVWFSNFFDNGREKRLSMFNPCKIEGRAQLLPQIIESICNKGLNAPWAKVYRREIIEKNHIRFPVGASVAEDRVFNIKYSMYIKSFASSDLALYYVNTENENSLTRGRHADLERQFEVTGQYFLQSLREAPIPESEKDQYQRAVNFGNCRGIYHDAKLLHQDHVGWFARQKRLGQLCDAINRKHMKYPKTRYCTLVTLPVRLRLTPVIDVIAWKLTH